jgi:hypothetical protein
MKEPATIYLTMELRRGPKNRTLAKLMVLFLALVSELIPIDFIPR